MSDLTITFEVDPESNDNFTAVRFMMNFLTGEMSIISRDKYGKVERTDNDSFPYPLDDGECVKLPSRVKIALDRNWLPRRLNFSDNQLYFPAHAKFTETNALEES